MVKIAFVINYIKENGPSSVVCNIINYLSKEKYKVTLITLFSGNGPVIVQRLRANGVTVIVCKTLTRWGCLFGFDKEFRELLIQGDYNIVHTHGLIPDILSAHLKTHIRRISTLHNNMFEDYPDSYGYLKSKIFIWLHLKALRKLDQIVCCSKSVYKVMERYLKCVSYVRNGIENISHSVTVVDRSTLCIPKDARVFLYAGMLTSRKQVVWMIKNFVEYREENEYLIVLGTGSDEARCKSESDNHVKMLGFKKDVMSYMKMADVYISASKSEGFSISILEALSCGMGLFLSDIPAHREVITMGKNIYLGECFDRNHFEEAIIKIREKRLNKKQISAFQRKELSAIKMAAEYESEYEQNEKSKHCHSYI